MQASDELTGCPECGALPCDWVNTPHQTMQASDAVERLCGALERESVYPLQIGHPKKREFATAIRALLAAIEAKDAALLKVRPILQAYATANPKWFDHHSGTEQDPNGVHALLAALTAPAQAKGEG